MIGFTVTEAGYYLTPAHELDLSQADIQADLRGEARTIYGALTRILRQRVASGGAPVTLLNCDNLRHNGERFRHGMLAFLAAQGDSALASWVRDNTTSPNTMVDRITPRPTPDVAERVKAATGKDDGAAVMAESFIQWVIEDDFIAGRPAAGKGGRGAGGVGAAVGRGENPHSQCHARSDCLGRHAHGHDYIDDSTRQPAIYQLAYDYITQDVIPSLSPSPLDLADYRDVVLARFSNPYIKDTNQRVGADGLSKIPGMVTPTLRECYQRGAEPTATAVLPALFYLFLQRWASNQLPYAYQDGVLNADALRQQLSGENALQTFLSDRALFAELADDRAFHALVTRSVDAIEQQLLQPATV